ncbi:yiaY [Symbiodinium sp. CCMP2592]|nr:yiaY [Symbiodinium sp. CCMP2592]
MEKFLPCLKSEDRRMSSSTRRLFEKKISEEVIATHFQSIVPPLLSDPVLQSWSFGFLQSKISANHLAANIGPIIVCLADQSWRVKQRALVFMQEQLPTELTADHVNHFVAIVKRNAWEVGRWILDLLKQRMPNSLWEHVLPYLSDPRWEIQQQAQDLLEEKLPIELMADQMDKFVPWLTSADPRLSSSMRRFFEKKLSEEALAQYVQQIFPPLLTDPVLQSWSFGFLRTKIPANHLTANAALIIEGVAGQCKDWRVKQQALLFMQEQLPSKLEAGHVNHMVAILSNSAWEVRQWILAVFRDRMPKSLLAQHWEKVLQLLFDPKCEVRQQARNLLAEKMPSEQIAQHMERFLPLLKSTDEWVKSATQHFFEKKISEEDLAQYFQKVVPPLLADSELRSWSFGVLTGRISAKDLAELIDWIAFLAIEEQSWERQESALKFMRGQLPAKLKAAHVGKIAALLASSECRVKTWTLALLHERMPSQLLSVLISEHGEILWPLFEIEDPTVTAEASTFVLQHGLGLAREQLAEHSRQFASLLLKTGHLDNFEHIFPDLLKRICPQHELAELLRNLPVSSLFVARSSEDLVRWRDGNGNTWLHLAAAAGHLEACEALVDQVGLPLREKNEAGDEPLALAANRQVDRFLRSRMHFRETRFGYGNAFEEMMQDDRPVSEVTWYTVPLPGMAGNLGGLHSFLLVTVVDKDQRAKSYVLEKAGSRGREAHQKHGIFIGSQDLGSNLKSVHGLQMHQQLKLSNGSLQTGHKMKGLYEVAHSTGPYDLAASNCHHAAQTAFNHCCAREEDKELRPPNELLAKLGAAFQLGGLFHSASSGHSTSFCSEGSGSDVASANSEVASSSHPAGSPSGFSRSVDLRPDGLAEVAAALSHAVYEEDAAAILKPLETKAVSIRNKLERPVYVYNHSTQESHRVEAEAFLNLVGCNVEKVFVDIYAVAWTPGLKAHRRLAQKRSVWMGHAYTMATDFRDEVVLREVVSSNVLYTTKKSRCTSPAQWLLARSGSAIYVAFQGTSDLQDAAIDLAAVPDYTRFEEHGIGVHSGIAHALEQRGDGVCHVVTDVLQALEQHRQPGERLVLCGHSLGGGYAQVMAVHLLSRNVEVAAVRTFGAPHVLVPPPDQEDSARLWQKLSSITQHWVHDWDPVPRLPLCKAWLTDVLPNLKLEVVRGVRVGVAQKYVEKLKLNYDETRAPVLESYDVVGDLLLVSKDTTSALRAREGAAPLKELLSEKPPQAVMTSSKLLAYHNIADYLQLARMLTTS